MYDSVKRYEIGSHFCLESFDNYKTKNDFDWFANSRDGAFTFSGRTAITIAIRDALQTKIINKAYLPSYCCSSMVQPFIDLNIAVEFYDVTFNGQKIDYIIDETKQVDLFLIMKYFGGNTNSYVDVIRKMKSKGCIVIEDITHIFLDEKNKSSEADYFVASLRKWFPIPAGGLITKRKEDLQIKPDKDSDSLVDIKLSAMKEKGKYLTGKTIDKVSYLKKYAQFESSLSELDSIGLRIDNVSRRILETINLKRVKNRRKNNALILYQRLKTIEGLCFLVPEYDLETQVPLFVPIMLPKEKRDRLRDYLISKNVYCPVHWPEVPGAKPGIRDSELSLICDQRYNEKDMYVIVDYINNWFKTND